MQRGPSTSSSAQQQPAGQCPLRKVLGPLAPAVFSARLACPEPIMRARAALAATKPVRELRPHALPVKLAAVGATSLSLNVPCGMWREHCEKFSGAWFLAVHASIPFIAMLRKAVIMPKYAIIFSLATAIAGQTLGSRLERRRLRSAGARTGAPTFAASASSGPAAALLRPSDADAGAAALSGGQQQQQQPRLVWEQQGRRQQRDGAQRSSGVHVGGARRALRASPAVAPSPPALIMVC